MDVTWMQKCMQFEISRDINKLVKKIWLLYY